MHFNVPIIRKNYILVVCSFGGRVPSTLADLPRRYLCFTSINTNTLTHRHVLCIFTYTHSVAHIILKREKCFEIKTRIGEGRGQWQVLFLAIFFEEQLDHKIHFASRKIRKKYFFFKRLQNYIDLSSDRVKLLWLLSSHKTHVNCGASNPLKSKHLEC